MKVSQEELLKALHGTKLDLDESLIQRLRVKADLYVKDNLIDPTDSDRLFVLNAMMIGAIEGLQEGLQEGLGHE